MIRLFLALSEGMEFVIKLVKAQKIYDYDKDGLQNLKWTVSKASHYFDLAAKNLQKVMVKELNVTTVAIACVTGTSITFGTIGTIVVGIWGVYRAFKGFMGNQAKEG